MNALPDLLNRSNPEIVCCILNCMTGYIQTKNIYSIQMLYSIQGMDIQLLTGGISRFTVIHYSVLLRITVCAEAVMDIPIIM